MAGTVVIIIILSVLVPVAIIMTGLLFSGILGTILQKDVDREHEGSELFELSRKDFSN
ncbi:MAG: hypothetical protein VYA88_04875 [Actinomycetota bacterium]|nr:hypothetical protein [Actinomycetota bacterium]MED5265458.1 hypothetical protein [Actinomycetota bacterium]|tara:strand:+ start:604 stop:777 length:174 start_codon:yes stop_codon:yes gene_type:complete